nr:hypothetical protein [Tanacetum cinerariifolium]
MCDVHLVNNATPLEAKDHFEIVINSNDDNSSSDDESLYKENIDGSTTTLSDISLPDYEAFSFDDDHIKEISSGSTTTHSDISLSEYDSFIFDFTDEEFADELAHIISLPEGGKPAIKAHTTKLKKIADEMPRQRCTSGDEHRCHIDQIKNFLKSDIVWESRKENPVSPHPRKTTPLVLSCQRDPEAPALSLINQDWLLWSLSVFIRSSVIWEIVHDFQLGIESYQQKVNLNAPIISFLEVEKHEMFFIIYETVHRIIYKNSKKEKIEIRHLEIYKFYDATLNRVLEGLKSYNNDVRYGYNQRDLFKDGVEYLKLFEEETEDRLKYRRQMRRWESYVNGRPLGQRIERLE